MTGNWESGTDDRVCSIQYVVCRDFKFIISNFE